MVRLNGVDDVLFFPVLPGVLHAQRHVGALELVVKSLADVVEQTGALGSLHVRAQLRRHHAGDMADLDGVLQHVLAVAGAVVQLAQQLLQLRVQSADTGLQHGALALGTDDAVHLPASLLHHLLDVGGVDAPVGDELFQSQTRYLAADRLEAGDGDRLRRVVDDEIRAGQRLQRADIASLAPDDTTLHLVVGQGHHADGDLRHVVGGAALDGGRHDLAGALIRLVLGTGLDLLDLQRRLVGDLGLHLGDEVFLRLIRGEAGNALQHLGLAALDELDLLLLLVQGGVLLGKGFFLLLDHLGLVVEILFLLLQTAFLLLLLGAAFLDFLLVLAAVFQNLFFCFEECFSLLVFRALDCLVDDTQSFLLGVFDLALVVLLLAAADKCADRNTQNECDSEREDCHDPASCGHGTFLLCCCVGFPAAQNVVPDKNRGK